MLFHAPKLALIARNGSALGLIFFIDPVLALLPSSQFPGIIVRYVICH